MSSQALEYSASLSYQGEYRDNAARAASESDRSDIVHLPGISLAAQHLGPAIELALEYLAERRIYQDDTFGDETVLGGGVDVTWNAIPGRLQFFGSNRRQETEIRRSEQDIPSNRQQTSDSALGANLVIDSIANHFMTLGYRYSTLNLDETGNDSERQTVDASYSIPLSQAVFSLNARVSRVEFDDPLIPEYETVAGGIGYSRETDRSMFSASVGYESIDRDLSRDTVDGYTGDLEFTRELSATSSAGLFFSQSYRDNSLEFGRAPILSPRPLPSSGGFVGDTDISEVFQEKRYGAFYSTQIGINQINLGVDATRQAYDDVPRDEKSWGVSADLSRTIRSDMDAYIGGGYRDLEFAQAQQDEDELYGFAGVSWQRSRRLGIGLSVNYFTREPKGSGGESVDDWAATLTIDYLLVDRFRR